MNTKALGKPESFSYYYVLLIFNFLIFKAHLILHIQYNVIEPFIINHDPRSD